MSATDELRKLLDERGVEWWESRGYGTGIVYTFWNSPTFGRVHAIENDDGTLFMDCLNNCDFTPAQAIAATLGEQAALNKAAGNWAHVDNLLRGLLEECERCPDTGCTQYIEKVVKPNMRSVGK